MKKLYFLFITFFITINVFGQSFKLISGEVYKYDLNKGDWSSQPLEKGALLSYNDSIKALTPFQIEVPKEYSKYFNNEKFYTTNRCEKGTRLTNALRQKTDQYIFIPSNTITMGDPDSIRHYLAWILNNTDNTFQSNISAELFDSNTWKPINENDNVSLNTPIQLTISNLNDKDVYIYILWKDIIWKPYWEKYPDGHFRISEYSKAFTDIKLGEPIGEQKILIIATTEELPKDGIPQLIDKKYEPFFYDELQSKIQHQVIKFNLKK